MNQRDTKLLAPRYLVITPHQVLMNQRDAKLKKKFEQPEAATWYDGKPAADEAAAVAQAAPAAKAAAPAEAAAEEVSVGPSTTTVVEEVVVGYPSKEVVVVEEVVLGLTTGSAAAGGYSCKARGTILTMAYTLHGYTY